MGVVPKHQDEWMKFESVEQQRAWQSAIERVYSVINQLDTGAKSLHRIKKLAEEGDLIASAIWAKFINARIGG